MNKPREKAKASENTSPYKRLRLKRMHRYSNQRSYREHINPIWVKMLYGGHWRRIIMCQSENQAVDVLVKIAKALRKSESE